MRKSYFFHGMAAMWAINSLSQDSMGKDKYLEWAASHWIDPSVTVPVALAVLTFVIVDMWGRHGSR